MRISLLVAGLALTAACADAPITAGDLQADGQLRERPNSQQSVHAASERTRPQAQKAERLRVTGLLAGQAEGPLEDRTRFSVEGEAIYLHLRADGLSQPRPVTFVWIHGDQRRETLGFLQPAETISLAASMPLSGADSRSESVRSAPERAAELLGSWTVEVHSTDANGRSLVFERTFEVLEPEAYALEATDPAAGVGQ